MTSVHERQASRLRLLLALYESTDADTLGRVNYRTLGAEVGLEDVEARRAAQYLVDEGLAKWAALSGLMAIEHWGIKEAESALLEQPTEHFSAAAINIVVVSGDSSVGSVQQGTNHSQQDG